MPPRQKEPIFRLFLLLFSCIILLYAILPKPAFSERENRPLAASPISAHDPSGTLSSYMRDRFPFRNLLVSVAAEAESRLFGESGGILRVGNRLVAREDHFDGTRFEANLTAVHALAEALALPYDLLLVPRPCDLPANKTRLYRSPSAAAALTALKKSESADLSDALTANDYYKTDHHLNQSGVEACITALFAFLEKEPPCPQTFTRLSDFRGSAYRQSGLFFFPAEELLLPRFANEGELRVTDAGGRSIPLYDTRFFASGDRYSAFLGGNHPVLTVTHKKEARERILVLRDSYASPVLPYLAQYYDVTAVDPRSFRGDLASLAKESGATRILLLSGLSLLTDEGFLLYFEPSVSSGNTSG